VEFRLDERRKPRDITILQAEPRPDEQYRAALRLSIGAEHAIERLQFDQSDRTKPDTQYPYRVTVILCLEPGGHCGDIMPFPHTAPVMLKEKPYPPVDFPIS
jgi:hypothetical protein